MKLTKISHTTNITKFSLIHSITNRRQWETEINIILMKLVIDISTIWHSEVFFCKMAAGRHVGLQRRLIRRPRTPSTLEPTRSGSDDPLHNGMHLKLIFSKMCEWALRSVAGRRSSIFTLLTLMSYIVLSSVRGVKLGRSKTRSWAVAVIADRTACSSMIG